MKAGEAYQAGRDVRVWVNVGTGSAQSDVESNIINSYVYLDIDLDRPPSDSVPEVQTDDAGNKRVTYKDIPYYANDCSAADLDGDGALEVVVKWEPSNAGENATSRVTSPLIFDAYDVDYSTGAATRMWRIDLGYNVRCGAHYNPFIVYDLDQDGKAELAVRTAPGSRDGRGAYVSAAGATAEIRAADDAATYYNKYEEVDGQRIPTAGNLMGGPEYLTLFNGETGAAISTVGYWPARDIVDDWGDDYGNRSERYLASVAYLDGKTPTLIMHRGYYTYSFASAYRYDGTGNETPSAEPTDPTDDNTENGGTDAPAQPSKPAAKTTPVCPVFQLSNPKNGDRLYVVSSIKAMNYVRAAWRYEGVAFYAPKSGKPVYQLVSKKSGRSLYTTAKSKAGWKNRGHAFYAMKSGGVKVHPLRNSQTGTYALSKKPGEVLRLKKQGYRAKTLAFRAAR